MNRFLKDCILQSRRDQPLSIPRYSLTSVTKSSSVLFEFPWRPIMNSLIRIFLLEMFPYAPFSFKNDASIWFKLQIVIDGNTTSYMMISNLFTFLNGFQIVILGYSHANCPMKIQCLLLLLLLNSPLCW